MVSGGSGRVADRWIRPGRKGKFVFFSCRVTYGNSCSNFIIGSYSVGALRASRPIAFVHVAFCLVNTGFNLQQSQRQISALRRQASWITTTVRSRTRYRQLNHGISVPSSVFTAGKRASSIQLKHSHPPSIVNEDSQRQSDHMPS